jgi:hypothetical protein
MQLIDYRSSHETPNHAMQQTSDQPAIYVPTVCHPSLDCESCFIRLAVAVEEWDA